MIEEKNRAELEEQGKLSELNSVLSKENEKLKEIKAQFEEQDARLRQDALSRLPEDKREKFAEIRKAKLRLSNIKLEEITQILRGKSKQIKH